MRAIDTNLLVRLIVRDDAAQVRKAETFVAQGAWVSHLVLAETLWVLDAVFQLAPAAMAQAVGMLLNHASLTLQDSDVVAAALAMFKKHPRLGFSDCLLVEIARKAGHLPVGTFDKKLARLDGTQAI